MAVGFGFAPPQGYPGGGTIKGYLTHATASTTGTDFTVYGGSTAVLYPVTFSLPPGIAQLIWVTAAEVLVSSPYTVTAASPLGYVDGAVSGSLQVIACTNATRYDLVAGGPLALTTTSIVLAWPVSGGAAYANIQYL